MKTCPHCGTEYPDDVAICTADGEALTPSMARREKMTGVWRGVYGYGEGKKRAGRASVAFTLRLKQGWLEHFTGSVVEDLPQGMPGTGSIDGYFNSPTIEFTKQMPVGYIRGTNGAFVSLREYILSKGHPCELDIPGPPITYQGTFLDRTRVQGIWIINPRTILLSGGHSLRTGRACGFWCAEFVASDVKADPTGGPADQLFDRKLLLPRLVDEVEGPALVSVGRFSVVDGEKILKRLEAENLRFEVSHDDAPIRRMDPVTSAMGGYSGMALTLEIFVLPDDVARVNEIIQQVYKL
jgi:hypothetical protein